jgi:hypothetical protein
MSGSQSDERLVFLDCGMVETDRTGSTGSGDRERHIGRARLVLAVHPADVAAILAAFRTGSILKAR